MRFNHRGLCDQKNKAGKLAVLLCRSKLRLIDRAKCQIQTFGSDLVLSKLRKQTITLKPAVCYRTVWASKGPKWAN